MAKIHFWAASLVFGFCLCTIQALNPTFSSENLGLQLAMTDWESSESLHDLTDIIEAQIPMNISTECQSAIHDWVFGLLKKDMNAIKMADACGKAPAGIFLGHILIFGHFDQCLALRRPNNVTGEMEPAANYCLTRLKHPKLEETLPALPAYGVCLPLECANGHDANAFVTGLFKVMRDAEEIEVVKGVCVSTTPKEVGYTILLCLILLIGLVITAASVVDCIYRRPLTDTVNNLHQDFNRSEAPIPVYHQTNKGPIVTDHHLQTQARLNYEYHNLQPFFKPVLCFNIMTNFRSIVSAEKEGEISYLHGFRVLSMWWIILGHTYYLGRNFFENQITFFSDVRTFGFQIILNAGYAVDSFFLLSGLLLAYVLARELSKHNGKLNWALVYFHRWWRLTPVYMFVMLFYVYVMPHGIESPIKLIIQQEGVPTDYCRSDWWTNILYINNLFARPKNKQCMNWTWFLALDMQFFIITPLLLFILYKSRVAGLAIIAFLVTGSVVTTMGFIQYYGLPVHLWQDAVYNSSLTGYNKEIDYIYEKPYTRIAPFVIGVALGYFFVSRPADKPSRRGAWSWLTGAIGWTVSFALAVNLIWGFWYTKWYEEVPPQIMPVGVRVLYGGLQRLGWSLVVGWILFACQYGYAGPVRRFLGSRFWRPLSNLTYGAYLIHMLTLQLYLASQRHMIFYSPINMVTIFLAQLFLAYGMALLLALLVEVPLLRLERLIIHRTL